MYKTLLMTGVVGLSLAATGAGAAAGTFAAGPVEIPAAYTLVSPGNVDPATGEPPSGCRTGELRITGRAKSLLFENITGHACSLQGHPGVAGLTATGPAAAAVLLAPGERLQAAVTCPAPVRGESYRVSAPGDTATAVVSAPGQACATGSVAGFTRALS
jgi:hypothetical protein